MNSLMETVCTVCNHVRNKTKQGISFHNLLTKIRREFRDHNIDLKVKSLRKKNLHSEEFYVNAYYDATDDQNGDTAIEVVIYHNFDRNIVWDRQHVTELLTQVFDAVVHEFKHQRQSRKRHYEIYWHNSHETHLYLSDPDEVDAYAFSIAIELCRILGKVRALRYMPKFSSLSRLKIRNYYVSPSLFVYVKTFGNLDDHILKTLAKKVYVRLQKVDTDHIFL